MIEDPDGWHPKWPTPLELEQILKRRGLYYKPPADLRDRLAEDIRPEDVRLLCQHPAWAMWVWNPYVDWVVPPSHIPPQHWLNAAIQPLHGPCVRAIHESLPEGFLHRVKSGEVTPADRDRYFGPEAYYRDVWGDSDRF
jgi:hypothetical protein